MQRTGAFSVAEVLRQTRKRASLSQAELARQLGWASSKVCSLEMSGRIRPDELLFLAGVLGIDPKALFDEVLAALLGLPHRERTTDNFASQQRISLARKYVAAAR